MKKLRYAYCPPKTNYHFLYLYLYFYIHSYTDNSIYYNFNFVNSIILILTTAVL